MFFAINSTLIFTIQNLQFDCLIQQRHITMHCTDGKYRKYFAMDSYFNIKKDKFSLSKICFISQKPDSLKMVIGISLAVVYFKQQISTNLHSCKISSDGGFKFLFLFLGIAPRYIVPFVRKHKTPLCSILLVKDVLLILIINGSIKSKNIIK